MSTRISPRERRGLSESELAALRRVAAHMRAEAAELEAGSWVRDRLEEEDEPSRWSARVLPELRARLDAASENHRWIRGRSKASRLSRHEEAALRRLGALMRAEAAELDRSVSAVARRLDAAGIRLSLECEDADRLSAAPSDRVFGRRFAPLTEGDGT